MSVAPSPLVSPRPVPPKPGIVPARPGKPRRGGLWVGLMLAAALLVGAVFYIKTRPAKNAAS